MFAVAFSPLMVLIVAELSGSGRRGRASGFLASVMALGDGGARLAVAFLLAGAVAVLAASVVLLTFTEPDREPRHDHPVRVETAIGITQPGADDD